MLFQLTNMRVELLRQDSFKDTRFKKSSSCNVTKRIKKVILLFKVQKYGSILPIDMKFVDFMKNLKANRSIKREMTGGISSHFKDNRILSFKS